MCGVAIDTPHPAATLPLVLAGVAEWQTRMAQTHLSHKDVRVRIPPSAPQNDAVRRFAAAAGAGLIAFTALGPVQAAPAVEKANSGVTRLGGVPAPKTSIAWGPCKDPDLKDARAQCGRLQVPLDWADPGGRKISLAVSRLRADPAARRGVLLTNPGGPGGSGLALPAYLQPAVPDKVGEAYDWIGFDPRGVGASRPALSCDTEYWTGPRPAYRLTSATTRAANEKAWIRRSKAYAAACGEENGELLRHMRTADTVADMNALRIALGEKQISYYGFSYGTYLGQAFASRYPGRVRRMVLDGNVAADSAGYGDGGRVQAVAFEKVMNQFFEWVGDHDKSYGLGLTGRQVRAAYNDELAKLTRQPVRGIGPAEFATVVQLAGYAESEWPEVADAIADWRSGKYYSTRSLYSYAAEVGDDNSYAAFLATTCTDAAFPRSYRTVRSDAFSIAKSAPFSAWINLWFAAPCVWWPVSSGRPSRIDGSRLHVPILLIQATGDGAAPYSGAVDVRREFPSARLLAEQGATTHAGSLFGNVCIDDAIAVYLADGTLPDRRTGDGPDKSCPRMPVPEPSAKDRSLAADPPSQFAGPPSGSGGLADLFRRIRVAFAADTRR